MHLGFIVKIRHPHMANMVEYSPAYLINIPVCTTKLGTLSKKTLPDLTTSPVVTSTNVLTRPHGVCMFTCVTGEEMGRRSKPCRREEGGGERREKRM